MKKISQIILSILCLLTISFSFAGCTNSTNARLIDISNKYDKLGKNYTTIFQGNSFNPTYQSFDLASLINSTSDINYSVLTSNSSQTNFDNRGAFAILMQSVNSTYLNNNALQILSNNKITNQKYKKAMYESLEKLEKSVKSLNVSKKQLEDVFENDSRDAEVISKQELTLYHLKNYKNKLTVCLKDLLKLNRNYNLAIVYNISKTIKLEELLYEKASITIEKGHNNQLINTANILISNYILEYDIDVLNDVNDNELLTILTKLLNLQAGLKSEGVNDENAFNKYKVLRTFEYDLTQLETSFTNNIKNLNSNNLNDNLDKVEFVNSYRLNLINYGNKLIDYLKSI